jgi:hypothetical protein
MFFSKSRSKDIDQINALIERVARLERAMHQHQLVMTLIARYGESDIARMSSARELVKVINDIPKI